MSFLWAIAVSLLVAAVIAVSAIANWAFGWSQGTAEEFPFFFFWHTSSAQLLAIVSLAVDGLKCLLLFGVSIGLMSRTRRGIIAGTICLIMWLGCLGWSAMSAVGFVSLNHQHVVDSADKAKDAWGDAKSRMERLQQQRSLVPVHRELDIVRSAIENKRAERLFDATGNCRDVRGPKAAAFCQDYRGLLAEEISASAANKLDAEIEKMRHERDNRQAVSVADPLAASLAKLTSTPAGDVSIWRSWFFAFFVEFISALGLWSIWSSRGDAALIEMRKIGNRPFVPNKANVESKAPIETETASLPAAHSMEKASQAALEAIETGEPGMQIAKDESREPVKADERKTKPAIEALKAEAHNPRSDLVDDVADQFKAEGRDEFTLDEIMHALAPLCAARNAPLPDRRIVGKRLSELLYEVDRPKTYSLRRGRGKGESKKIPGRQKGTAHPIRAVV